MYVFPPFASLTVEEFLTHYFTSSDYKEDGNGMRVQVLSSRFGGVRMICPGDLCLDHADNRGYRDRVHEVPGAE